MPVRQTSAWPGCCAPAAAAKPTATRITVDSIPVKPPLQWLAAEVLDPLGQIFLRLLFFVIVPLVFASLLVGTASLGDPKKLGRIVGGPGHRATGDRRKRARGVGWEVLHVAIDDATRLVYAEILPDERKESARKKIPSQGIYGPVTVKSWQEDGLPYVDNMVNLVIAEDLSAVALDEVFRVLAPYGVVLSKTEIEVKGSSHVDGWYKAVKPWPENMDQWTHWLHAPDNNAVSKDAYNEIPRGLQWVQPPRWWKSHELAPPFSAMVTANGRLFYMDPGQDLWVD